MSERIRTYWRAKTSTAWVEITQYVVGPASVRIFRGRKRIPGGTMTLDDSMPVVISPNDRIRLSVDDGTTETIVFSGLFIPSEGNDDDKGWKFQSFKWYFKKARANGVYLSKKRSEILRLLIDEYLPGVSWTEASIPVGDDEEIINERFISRPIGDVFDKYTESIGDKVWDVDPDGLTTVSEQTFSDSGVTLTDADIVKRWRLNFDVSKWNTQPRVEGASTEIVKQKDVTGSTVIAADNVITLDFSAKTIEVKQIPSGQEEQNVGTLRGVLAGTDQELTNIDFLYDPAAKTVTLTDEVSVSGSDTFRIKQTGTSLIASEQINPIAYQKHGLVQGAPFVNSLIGTQEKADEVCQQLADKYGDPLEIYTFDTSWNPLVVPGVSVTLNSAKRFINKIVNVMELAVQFGGSEAPSFNVMLNNINLDAVDAFEELAIRVRQLEERQQQSDSFVTKLILWYHNLALDIYRVRHTEYDLGNSFRLDDTSGTANLDNAARYLDGVNGSGELTFVSTHEVYNAGRKIKLFMNDESEWDLDNSTASLDVENARVTF